jgi:hydrogenase-4 component B
MPRTALLFLVGAVSISALPPFNGFVSELMIFLGFLQAGALHVPMLEILLFVCLALFALTSSLAAACFVKAFGITFLARPRSPAAGNAKEAGPFMLIGPAVLAVLCVLLGVFSLQIFLFLGISLPIPDLMMVGSLGLVFVLLVAFFLKITARSGYKKRIEETWGCGINSQNSGMEYTASGFSEPIVTIFKPIYRTRRFNEKEYSDRHGTQLKNGEAGIRLLKFFEEYLYLPVARFVMNVSERLSKIQDAIEPDSYILYAFVTCLLLLVIGGWFI